MTALFDRGVAQTGSALAWGARGRRFKSGRPDHCHNNKNKDVIMLSWVLLFLVVALVAGLLGFTGIAKSAAGIAKIIFYIFLILLLVSLVMSLLGR